jgi:hypothetical protein
VILGAVVIFVIQPTPNLADTGRFSFAPNQQKKIPNLGLKNYQQSENPQANKLFQEGRKKGQFQPNPQAKKEVKCQNSQQQINNQTSADQSPGQYQEKGYKAPIQKVMPVESNRGVHGVV